MAVKRGRVNIFQPNDSLLMNECWEQIYILNRVKFSKHWPLFSQMKVQHYEQAINHRSMKL